MHWCLNEAVPHAHEFVIDEMYGRLPHLTRFYCMHGWSQCGLNDAEWIKVQIPMFERGILQLRVVKDREQT